MQTYRGVNNNYAKLSEKQVLEIRRRYQPNTRGQGYISLSKRYRVCPSTIRRIVKRLNWWHLPGLLLLCAASWAQSPHYVTLSWNPSTTSGVTYSVYRSPKSGTGYVRRSANVKLLNWTDTHVTAGKTYYYVVRAVKKTVESANSNEVKAVIPTP